jgi:hypothetical protein
MAAQMIFLLTLNGRDLSVNKRYEVGDYIIRMILNRSMLDFVGKVV